MRLVFAYITAGSFEEARRLGKMLVEERMAACVNLLDGMSSLYRWQGEVARENEVVILAKTRADLFERLVERVEQEHSYEVPCIIEIPMDRVSSQYRNWLIRETEDDA